LSGIREIFFIGKIRIGLIQNNQDFAVDFFHETQDVAMRLVSSGGIIRIAQKDDSGLRVDLFQHTLEVINTVFQRYFPHLRTE
jgi:hypothetical protein